MQPTPAIEQFVERIVGLPAGPGISLDAALKPSLDEEAELRKLFATDRSNPRIANPHAGLVDVFAAPDAIRTTRARIVKDEEDLSANYVMPISEDKRRKEGTPCMVNDLDEFKKNWAIFTEGSLSQLIDWNNVIAAGGSVLACLQPLSDENTKSKRAMRKFYHTTAYPTSDVDLFLWGMNAEQAEAKINSIYEAVRDSVPWDVTCVRTKHTVSIHCQYPYRSVQIVLRLYQSPAEILAGFDIDVPCCAYDGNRVWANPRAVVAMMRQCNTTDVTRRSPSYEVRLSKYSTRGFEVYVPNLRRGDIDPTIYERAIAKMEGLARLLVLEKLTNTDTRYAFLENRRQLRGRPDPLNRYRRRRGRTYKGDLKQQEAIGGLEMNDYDVASLHIPYGPGWEAKRIDKLIYQTDLGMNSTFNPKNKGRRLHRHPAFFGTMEECLEDCCENCPIPIDDDERALQAEEDGLYIHGRIKFIEENPGRQTMTGSFNPIDEGEWSEQVYVKPVQQLFAAIASGDRPTVQELLGAGIDVHQRDHVGRSPLHVAIICKQERIAGDLIDAGARMIARLVDGRTCLHLAAQMDLPFVVRKLFEKSAKNQEEVNAKNPKDEDEDEKMKDAPERPSSEDDWSSHEEEDIEMVDAEDEEEDNDSESGKEKKAKTEEKEKGEGAPTAGDLPEDEEDEPDIIEVDQYDWDVGFTALDYAILFGSLPLLDELIANGASVKLATTTNGRYGLTPIHPLTLCLLRDDEDAASNFAERLIQAGATSSTATTSMRTILHQVVEKGRAKLLATILRCDTGAKSVLDFPALNYNNVLFPVTTAVAKQRYATLAVLLAYGAKIELDEVDVTRAMDVATAEGQNVSMGGYGGTTKNYLEYALEPVEAAVMNRDDIVQLLVAIGAHVNIGLKRCVARFSDERSRRTILDWINYAITSINSSIHIESNVLVPEVAVSAPPAEPLSSWEQYLQQYKSTLVVPEDPGRKAELLKAAEQSKKDRIAGLKEALEYMEEVKKFLLARDAQSWPTVYSTVPTQALSTQLVQAIQSAQLFQVDQPTPLHQLNFGANTRMMIGSGLIPTPVAPAPKKPHQGYSVYTTSWNRQAAAEHQIPLYDQLFEACYTGNNEKIQQLCLPLEDVKGGPLPLNINVIPDEGAPIYIYSNGPNYTPLFAAVAGRRWATAKLILAIAAAQYHPDDEEQALKWTDDNDSDANSDCSGDSDVTVEQPEFKFVDIATRPSAVQCKVHPRNLLQFTVPWRKDKTTSGTADLLQKAIIDHDLETFVQIANLYSSLPQAIPLGLHLLTHILSQDVPDILDEFIRRTGCGIDVKHAQKETGEIVPPPPVNDANRVYLGLNVHGKKRADLARKNDPMAHFESHVPVVPLLWQAIQKRAKKVIDYLSTGKPLAAYRFYSISHSDEGALWLRRTSDLEKNLPSLLGWKANVVGESPLSAAVISGDLDTLKVVIAKCPPKLVSAALHLKVKWTGFNLLTFAVEKSCRSDMIDFLLSRHISPAEKDTNKGWNIYHYLASKNNGDLFEHFLKKLPRDVNEVLLNQQSKLRSNTPLHVAVKLGSIRIVRLIVDFSTHTLTSRDIDAQTPLHAAIKKQYPKVTRILLKKMDGNAIRMEDGVGHTAWDTISLADINSRVRTFCISANYFPGELNPTSAETTSSTPYTSSSVNRTISNARELQETIDKLLADGRLKNQTRLVSELNNFAALLESRAQRAKTRHEEEKAKSPTTPTNPPTNPGDSENRELTLEYLQQALKEKPGQRQLVHLIDVQKSVAANLDKVGHRYVYSRRDDEGFDAEDAEEIEGQDTDNGHGMLLGQVDMALDTL